MKNQKEYYRELIVHMVNGIDCLDFLIRIYNFVKSKYDRCH